jgi:hypothetical protein
MTANQYVYERHQMRECGSIFMCCEGPPKSIDFKMRSDGNAFDVIMGEKLI